ncbi:hypothetical protein K505DRAFT_213728, partial [Melanomma pulvis-pyrius CBS 109.77]
LLSLADELLLCIIDQVDSREALCSLAATCSRFQNLVEPYCWRSLLVRKGGHASRIALSLNNRVERIAFIQELAICYNNAYEHGIENLGGFMPHMDKLRHLTIESPCPNNSEWRRGAPFDSWTRIDYTTLFETASLPMLQSFTLHGHPSESRKCAFGRTAIIFFHPTLRNITISCSNFDAGINSANITPDKLKSSPLQSLKLIECNVYLPFLSVILSLPRALKDLSIGERLHVFDEHPSHVPEDRTSNPAFLDALAQQADSLERLVHIAGDLRYAAPPIPGDETITNMRRLTHLSHLEVGIESPLFSYLNRHGCPDSLQTLKITDHAVVPTPTREHTRVMIKLATAILDKHILTPINLDMLFAYNHFSTPSLSGIWNVPQPTARKQVYDLAKILQARGSRLRILTEEFKGGKAFIPPYMDGEDMPVEVVQYDSESFWTFCGVDHQRHDD